MKKLVTLVIAAAAIGSIASAATITSKRGIEKQLTRIEAVLGDTERGLSEQKRAFLQDRQEVLQLQLQVRETMRAAVADLGDAATEEQIKAARQAVREQYKEQFAAIKEQRRAEHKERKSAREAPLG